MDKIIKLAIQNNIDKISLITKVIQDNLIFRFIY